MNFRPTFLALSARCRHSTDFTHIIIPAHWKVNSCTQIYEVASDKVHDLPEASGSETCRGRPAEFTKSGKKARSRRKAARINLRLEGREADAEKIWG